MAGSQMTEWWKKVGSNVTGAVLIALVIGTAALAINLKIDVAVIKATRFKRSEHETTKKDFTDLEARIAVIENTLPDTFPPVKYELKMDKAMAGLTDEIKALTKEVTRLTVVVEAHGMTHP